MTIKKQLLSIKLCWVFMHNPCVVKPMCSKTVFCWLNCLVGYKLYIYTYVCIYTYLFIYFLCVVSYMWGGSWHSFIHSFRHLYCLSSALLTFLQCVLFYTLHAWWVESFLCGLVSTKFWWCNIGLAEFIQEEHCRITAFHSCWMMDARTSWPTFIEEYFTVIWDS